MSAYEDHLKAWADAVHKAQKAREAYAETERNLCDAEREEAEARTAVRNYDLERVNELLEHVATIDVRGATQ